MRFRSLTVPMGIDKALLSEVVRKAGKTLTQQRLLVAATLADSTDPKSAYELRDQINATGENLNISTIYRVLYFWCALGIVHKIESANRFMVCTDEHRHQFHVIQHCTRCETITESCELASQMNMQPSCQFEAFNNQVIEIQGTCANCLGQA
jgi:Fur family zinc uptake transcriptional regulator